MTKTTKTGKAFICFPSRRSVVYTAALNVTEPASTGIGGDCFCLFYDAKNKKVNALNGSGRSPAKLTLEYVHNTLGINQNNIPFNNINAATVPGAAAAWVDTINNFGSGKLNLSEILQPAIDLAENGFPVSEISAWMWKKGEDLLMASPNGGDMLINGHAPKTGEIMLQSKGGVMSLDDLAAHTTSRVDPISIDYKGFTIWECPPNGQGITALMTLGILESLQESGKIKDLSKMQHNSVEYLHAIIESLRLAFEDTKYYVCDPKDYHIPVKELLSKKYLAKRAQLFDSAKATVDIEKGSPDNSSDTVYFSVVDDEGNACSYINSIFHGFGTAAVPEDCGFILHCRGASFVLKKGHPNCLKPNKRPYHTIIPSIVTKNDELWLSFGGHNIVTIKEWDREKFGRGQVIQRIIDENTGIRVWCGGSDPRGDGQVIGW
ncbi:11877_t:CDS:10 [Diversispora eburnea]|uniref:11877_t:CDS:1 n=1 Tax=Diversispora eburnea TaxID=1213867 RepID=A0A9N8VKY1_9GLOM|nr:11877_t:CDS:10 [Diversispora eburnea]